MKIGEASEKSGLPAKTIRYYEDIGFVEPHRRDSGYRDFDEHQIEKLAFIRRARSLGFSVTDCQTLLALQDQNRSCRVGDERSVDDFIAEIDCKLNELKEMRLDLNNIARERAASTPNVREKS